MDFGIQLTGKHCGGVEFRSCFIFITIQHLLSSGNLPATACTLTGQWQQPKAAAYSSLHKTLVLRATMQAKRPPRNQRTTLKHTIFVASTAVGCTDFFGPIPEHAHCEGIQNQLRPSAISGVSQDRQRDSFICLGGFQKLLLESEASKKKSLSALGPGNFGNISVSQRTDLV